MTSSEANAPSTISRKVGCNDDPGLSSVEKKLTDGVPSFGAVDMAVETYVPCDHKSLSSDIGSHDVLTATSAAGQTPWVCTPSQPTS